MASLGGTEELLSSKHKLEIPSNHSAKRLRLTGSFSPIHTPRFPASTASRIEQPEVRLEQTFTGAVRESTRDEDSVFSSVEFKSWRYLQPRERNSGDRFRALGRQGLGDPELKLALGESRTSSPPMYENSVKGVPNGAPLTDVRPDVHTESVEGAFSRVSDSSDFHTVSLPQDMQVPSSSESSMQLEMGGLMYGQLMLPPCDRCRRSHRNCLKDSNACMECTRLGLHCTWLEVSEEELQQANAHSRKTTTPSSDANAQQLNLNRPLGLITPGSPLWREEWQPKIRDDLAPAASLDWEENTSATPRRPRLTRRNAQLESFPTMNGGGESQLRQPTFPPPPPGSPVDMSRDPRRRARQGDDFMDPRTMQIQNDVQTMIYGNTRQSSPDHGETRGLTLPSPAQYHAQVTLNGATESASLTSLNQHCNRDVRLTPKTQSASNSPRLLLKDSADHQAIAEELPSMFMRYTISQDTTVRDDATEHRRFLAIQDQKRVFPLKSNGRPDTLFRPQYSTGTTNALGNGAVR